MASNRAPTRPTPVKTDLDDWETDPDYVRDMDEIDQRWGSKRTVGSINMNELIDQVQRDHKTMRERYDHPSQKDYSEGFGGKYGIQHDRKDQSAHDYDYHEKLSKHTSQEISKKIITSSTSSVVKSEVINDAKRTLFENSNDTFPKARTSPVATRTNRPIYETRRSDFGGSSDLSGSKSPSSLFEKSSSTKHIVREEKSSTTSKGQSDMPQAFKSIQDKINAFKKEFEDIENKLNKKADMSKVIKKTSNYEKSNDVEYVNRSVPVSNASLFEQRKVGGQSSSPRPTSVSPSQANLPSQASRDLPKTSIKSLSEKFESLQRDEGEQFRRETEAKRREFFDQIKNQVRETRKELDGFDSIDDCEEVADVRKIREKLDKLSPLQGTKSQSSRFSPTSPSSSRVSSNIGDTQSNVSTNWRPKVYTKRETTEERVVSRIVKENDKVIENETNRDVKRSSSCHGSSDEEAEANLSSIKLIDKELRSSPQQYTGVSSPINRSSRVSPVVEPEVKGAGLMARTLYDYQAAESDELSFDVDDLITNIKKVHADWYEGTITQRNGHKQVGLFPANYVKLLNDSGEY